MPWPGAVKARVDEAVARIHAQHGETVYVRRLLPSGSDDLYAEDLSRMEAAYRVIGVVLLNPAERLLKKFGQALPCDALFTFAYNNISVALDGLGNPFPPGDNGLYVQPGYVIQHRGIRYTVVKVPELKVPINYQDDGGGSNDQTTQWLEVVALAQVSTYPNVLATSQTQPVQPTVTVMALHALSSPTLITLTFSKACDTVGDVMQRLRVSVGGVVVALNTIVTLPGVELRIFLQQPVVFGQPVRCSYTPSGARPVTAGVIAEDNSEELAAVANAPVTVTND